MLIDDDIDGGINDDVDGDFNSNVNGDVDGDVDDSIDTATAILMKVLDLFNQLPDLDGDEANLI